MKDKKELDNYIGRQIKTARRAAGYSQEKFAELIGMGPKNVSAIERGAVGVSTLAIVKICQILGVTSDSILIRRTGEADDAIDKAVKKINVMVERLKYLTLEQLEITIIIINKILEAYSLNDKILTDNQNKRHMEYAESKKTYNVAESPKKPNI